MGQKNCTRGAQSEIDHNEGISLWETKYLIIHIIFFGPLAGSGKSPIIYIGRLLFNIICHNQKNYKYINDYSELNVKNDFD